MQKFWLGVVALLAVVVLGFTYQLLQQQQQLQTAYRLPEPRVVKAFQLMDAENKPVDVQQLYHQWTFVFVGYTSCPDICPMTMAMLSGAYPELQKLAGKQPVQIWFVSVDPKRDTQTQLHSYMEYFANPAIRAMTASHDQLYPFVRDIDLMYAIANDTSDDYRVDHSASIALIDAQGRLIASFKPDKAAAGMPPLVSREKLVADFAVLMQQVTQ